MDRWVGKVAVVTGASAGIGQSIARCLAERGIIVAGFARRAERIQELAAKTKGTIHGVKCDLTKESDILQAFRWVESKLGGVDLLVNCAGVASIAPLTDGALQDWKSMIDTNIVGLNICTREALKTMRTRGDDGQIIHINSVLGHHVPQFPVSLGMYSACKFAVGALTEALRVELQHLKSNIKITSISPGGVRTELYTDMFGGDSPLIEAQDVTDAILYVLSTRKGVQVHDLMIQAIGAKIY